METSKECVYSIAQVKEKYIESRELEGKAETGHLSNDWIWPGTGMSDLSIPRSYFSEILCVNIDTKNEVEKNPEGTKI